jgi:hypothetical protein
MKREDEGNLQAPDIGCPVRVVCINCGKLLFKLAPLDFAATKTLPSHLVEIKCYNHACKTINTINI